MEITGDSACRETGNCMYMYTGPSEANSYLGGGGTEKGRAMGISDRISRGVRGYGPPEIFEI